MDCSEFHNQPEEMEIGGVKYTFVSCLFDSGIFLIKDCRDLLELEYSDEEDSGKNNGKCHGRNVTGNESTDDYSSGKRVLRYRKRGKNGKYHRRYTIENETSDDDCTAKRVLRCRKKVYDRHDTSVFPMHMKIESRDCIKKRKITKRVEDYDTTSVSQSSSSQSSSQSKHKKFYTLSSQQYNDMRVKEESMQPPQEIFGYYFCEVCKLELSSEKVYHDHMNGKRHLKTLKLKNVSKAVAQCIPPSAATEGQSRYPQPPRGVIRRKVKERAKIQNVIKNEVRKPCPGLDLVTEIQGLRETTYYCSICNATCSSSSIIPHLTGFKHQLNLVKHFKPGDYETFSNERKNEMHNTILSILRAVQRREGLGRMTVEREELISCSRDMSSDVYQPSSDRGMQGTSLQDSGMSFQEYYDKAAIPNTSSADYFCEFCDAHMNSEDMWKAHIAGKRHITNLKKMPGDRPSKTKTVPIASARAVLLDRLENECPNETIVGLNEIREIQIKEVNSESYRCFLCASCHTALDIIEHLVSSKHRLRYLEHIQSSCKLDISSLSERTPDTIIQTICAQVEAEKGRGKPSVHIDKSAFHT